MKYNRQRYILFEIVNFNPDPIDQKLILKLIWKRLNQLFGLQVTFMAGLWMIRWDEENKIGIIRCDNITKYQVIAAMAFIKELDGMPVIFHTRKTTGTIKKTLKLWRHYFHTIPPKKQDN